MFKYATLLAVLALSASADTSDNMKGIGMPIIFICVYAIAVFLSHKQLVAAFQASRGDVTLMMIFSSSLLSSAMSLLLFFSPAFSYGLIQTVLAVFTASVCTGVGLQKYAHQMMVLSTAWFLCLVGLPSFWSPGIISAVSTTNCNSFYGTFSATMCPQGWVIVVEIIACVLISTNFLSLLAIVSAAMTSGGSGDKDAEYAAVGGHDSGNAVAPSGQMGHYQQVMLPS